MEALVCLGRILRYRAAGAAFAALALAVASAPAFATSIAAGRYLATDSVPYSFVDISSSGTRVLNNQDNANSTATIGFTFNFYGTGYTTVGVSSNGLLTFGGTNTDHANSDFTSASVSGNKASIGVFWDDLDFKTSNDASADAVYLQTSGAVGSRIFVIQWNRASHFPQSGVTFTGEVTFEAILYEGTGDILLQYNDVSWSAAGYDNGASATVGIRDVSGNTNGRTLQWSFNTGALSNSYAILFTPEPGTLALYGLGTLGLGAIAWSRRKHRHTSPHATRATP